MVREVKQPIFPTAFPDLPLPGGRPPRVFFAHASSLLVAQALTDAQARLERHFPALVWPTWGDALWQLQPDVLVEGNAVTFDWAGLARRVHRLVASPARPVAVMPAAGSSSAAVAAELRACQRRAAPVLPERQENPPMPVPLAHESPTQPAHGQALAERVGDAIRGVRPHPTTTSCPPVPEPFAPSSGLAAGSVGSPEELGEGPDAVSPLPGVSQPNGRGSTPRRHGPRRRTFRAIVARHPRGDGRFGFTVRELCRTMRISAASLAEARTHPGRLSVNGVVALAGAMGEDPLTVLADLLAEAGGKQPKKRKARTTRPLRPDNT